RQLEEEGLLTRTHGGAVLRTRASFEQASDAREIVNLSAKERIGQRAAALAYRCLSVGSCAQGIQPVV
ncbi:hypothetical protein V7P28_45935, partial [Klebsiella michiganensis]